MYWSDHAPPHFHARNGDMDAVFEIATGRMMGGRLDRRTLDKVQQWTELHRDALMEAWTDCRNGIPPKTIK